MDRKKRILILLAFAVMVWAVAPFFFPDTMVLRSATQIDAPASIVFGQLSDFRNWEFWSPWNVQKTMPEPKYSNHGLGRGGSADWHKSGENSYLQRFTFVSVEPYQFVEVAMDFPEKAFAVSRINLTETDGKTLVNWNIGMKTEGWKTLFFKINNQKTLKKALSNLASTATLWYTQNMQTVEYGIVSEFPYVSIRRQPTWEELSDAMGNMYDYLLQSAGENNYTIAGHAYAIYHSMGDEKADVECGFPVENMVPHQGVLFSGIFPETTCAITEYTGSYENLEKGHEAIQQWIDVHQFKIAGPPIEIFISKNSDSADPSTWKTKICYPIE